MWARQGEGRDRDEVLVGGPCLLPAAPGRRGCFCIGQEQRWTDALLGLKATVKWEYIKGAKETRGTGEADGGWSLLLGRGGPSGYQVPGIAGPHYPSPNSPTQCHMSGKSAKQGSHSATTPVGPTC